MEQLDLLQQQPDLPPKPTEVLFCKECEGLITYRECKRLNKSGVKRYWRKECKECDKARFKRNRREHKEKAGSGNQDITSQKDYRRKQGWVMSNGGSCNCCGYVSKIPGCYSIYDFHHLDPDLKEFAITPSETRGKSDEEISAELDKCVLLCKNCHPEIHWLINRKSLTLEESIAILRELKVKTISGEPPVPPASLFPFYQPKLVEEKKEEPTFKDVAILFNTVFKTWYKKIGQKIYNFVSVPFSQELTQK